MEISLGKLIFISVILFCLFTLWIFDALASSSQLQIRLASPPPVCGNNIKEGGEQCDGTDLNSQTCVSRGFSSGNLSCNTDCTFNTTGCTSGGGGGGGGGTIIPPATSVIFSGRAYPKSNVTLLKDAQIAGSTIAGDDANFQITLNDLSGGNYIFSLYSEDYQGRRSNLYTFAIGVTQGSTTNVSGIFIAPTIDVDKEEVKRSENIAIFGQSISQAEITIVVNSDQEVFAKTNTDQDGIYLYNFDTTLLEYGNHFTKSKAAKDGAVSSFSKAVGFKVSTQTTSKKPSEPLRGDSNNDSYVNLVDFSIAAYWYKRASPPAYVDWNGDNKVDLVDFSIMAYYWTG